MMKEICTGAKIIITYHENFGQPVSRVNITVPHRHECHVVHPERIQKPSDEGA